MFAIAVPSTLTLTTPTDDGGDAVPFATLTFSHPTDDVSKCMVTVITADGAMHEAFFNTQGGVIEQRFTSPEEIERRREAEDKVNEERAEHDRAVAEEANKRELRTADDTTDADVAWDAPHSTEIKTYPAAYEPMKAAAAQDAKQPVGLQPAELEPQHG